MHIDILTLFPEYFNGPFSESIVRRALQKQLVQINLHNIRNYATNKHKTVDDYPFGGGAGMVMQIEPIDQCMDELKKQRTYDEIIYLSPDGDLFDQPMANLLSTKKNLLFLITREISIGNYVLTGGETAATVVVDAIIRLIPGVLSDETSALSDSFQDNLISPPVYTRPANYKGWEVPEILISGHQMKIDEWRHEQSLLRTRERRPDLLKDE
jgi:tRNA (guanine37-N1)-methyltransferase